MLAALSWVMDGNERMQTKYVIKETWIQLHFEGYWEGVSCMQILSGPPRYVCMQVLKREQEHEQGLELSSSYPLPKAK